MTTTCHSENPAAARLEVHTDRIGKIIDGIHDESHIPQKLGLDLQNLGMEIEADDLHDAVPATKRLEKLFELRASIEAYELKYKHRCSTLLGARDAAAVESESLPSSA